MNKVKPEEIEIGQDYHLSGDMENGYWGGKPYICHEEITRPIKRVTETHIICACDRRFIINDNLTITIPHYRLNPDGHE